MSRYAIAGPNNLTGRDDVDPVFEVGGKFYDKANKKTYRYVKFDNGSSDVAAANGAVAYWKTFPTDVYSDLSDAAGAGVTTDRNFVAGIFVNAITDGRYGFIQIGGNHAAVKQTIDSLAAGDAVIAGNTDGQVDRTAGGTAPTHQVIGWALADDDNTADTVSVQLVLDN